MSEEIVPMTVRILDKEYRVACRSGEQSALLACAHYVDEKMGEIRSQGRVVGVERIAVMAALNMARELLEQRSERDEVAHSLTTQLQFLRDKVASALSEGRQMEL